MKFADTLDSKTVELLSKQRFSFDDVVRILQLLRAPNGCPWDREQTHQSIRSNAIEESYELADAIDRNDVDGMKEETGDLLLQSVFHCLIAQEKGEFDVEDVTTELCLKLICRHTHIFGTDVAENSVQALDNWEKNKRQIEGIVKTGDYMKKIPESTPSLMRAYKIQKRAKKVGFDWNDVSGAFDKVTEELDEVREAYAEGNDKHLEEELGDALFALVNVCRFCKIEPEVALNGANAKFIRRFCFIEEQLNAQGKTCEQSSLQEMDKLWNLAKAKGL